MESQKHIAFLPARKGSIGFPGKNRLFFDMVADFVQNSGLYDEILVSTDDEKIVAKAKSRGFTIHHRNAYLSGPAISMKQVLENVIEEMKIDQEAMIWLTFICLLYRDLDDFKEAKELLDANDINSLCTFYKAKTHPFDAMKYDEKTKRFEMYIPNEVFRRQDKPDAWAYYHYICVFRAGYLSNLNHELICSKTHPIFLDAQTTAKLVEIDTLEEYEAWKEKNAATT